jgi:hypothetical protein
MGSSSVLDQLLQLNVALQLFDGVATYHGYATWGEANPFLSGTMATMGELPALLLFKAKACGYLILLRRVSSADAARVGLTLTALAYGVFSFGPWMTRFGSLVFG